MHVLVVVAAGQRCGLPAATVREVARAARPTPLPGAPSVIEGVLDVRGQVVPVLDLRARLDLPRRAIEPSDYLVITTVGERVAALRTDDVLGLAHVEARLLDVLPNVVARGRSVAGAARLPDGLVLIHDPAAFLSQAESEALAAALEQRAAPGDTP